MSAARLQRVAAVNVGLDGVRRRAARPGRRGASTSTGARRPAATRDASRCSTRCGAATASASSAANARRRRAASRACAPRAVTVAPAGDVIAGLGDGVLLHSGPPIAWDARVRPAAPRAARRVPVRGLGGRPRRRRARCSRAGEIALRARQRARPRRADDRRLLAVDAGLGRRGRGGGARAFSTLNEGPGRTLWFGVGDDEAVERLRFFRDDARPVLARLLERTRPGRRARRSPPRACTWATSCTCAARRPATC